MPKYLEDLPNIVIIGETGHGKSTCCNRFIAKEHFKTGKHLHSETYDTTFTEALFGGKEPYGRYRIVDTPGFGDPDGDYNHTKKTCQVLKGLKKAKAFIWVFNGALVRFNIQTRQIL